MADTRPAAESRGTPERRDASPPRGTTLRDAVREIGVPRILIAVFFLALLAVAYTTHMDMPSLLGDCIRFGVAPAYLEIAGKWQDHVLYQVLRSETGPARSGRLLRTLRRGRHTRSPG